MPYQGVCSPVPAPLRSCPYVFHFKICTLTGQAGLHLEHFDETAVSHKVGHIVNISVKKGQLCITLGCTTGGRASGPILSALALWLLKPQTLGHSHIWAYVVVIFLIQSSVIIIYHIKPFISDLVTLTNQGKITGSV